MMKLELFFQVATTLEQQQQSTYSIFIKYLFYGIFFFINYFYFLFLFLFPVLSENEVCFLFKQQVVI